MTTNLYEVQITRTVTEYHLITAETWIQAEEKIILEDLEPYKTKTADEIFDITDLGPVDKELN
tara:strand:+ start:1054 stop:1242 length:189 start_codon:yes stop_codon:yes gene_type:complete